MFSNLPQEITLNILSRIPIKTVFTIKCVCKSWLKLIETAEFARAHVSNSSPGLLVHHSTETTLFQIFEFREDLAENDHNLHYKRVLELDINQRRLRWGNSNRLEGTADGLLFVRKRKFTPDEHYICNPITKEYIKLPTPEGIQRYPTVVTYGFGVSRSSRQYKAVRIFHECERHPSTHKLLNIPKFVCQVYTLGRGSSWRSIAVTAGQELLEYSVYSKGTFLNGNLHWLVQDLEGYWWVSCFDLEREVFTKFRAPKLESNNGRILMDIGALRGCLCLCDNSSQSEIVMYTMSSYEEKSWKKEWVFSKIPNHAGECYEVVYPIKYFGDGDVLMAWHDYHLFCYSDSTKRTESIDVLNMNVSGLVEALLYTPSLVSPRDFVTKSVKKF